MYEIEYGNRYEETKSLKMSEVAKLIRADIKAAFPAGFKWSVRTHVYSGGRSLHIDLKAAPCAVLNVEQVRWLAVNPHEIVSAAPPAARKRYSPEIDAALDVVQKICGRYNFDGSDIMTDYFHVRFYAFVGVDGDVENAERAAVLAASSNDNASKVG